MKKWAIWVGTIFLFLLVAPILFFTLFLPLLKENIVKHEAIRYMEVKYDAEFVVDRIVKRSEPVNKFGGEYITYIVEGRVVGGRLEKLPVQKVRLELAPIGRLSFGVRSDDYQEKRFQAVELNHPTTLRHERFARKKLEHTGYKPMGYHGKRFVEKEVETKFRIVYYSLHVQTQETDRAKLKQRMKELVTLFQEYKEIQEIHLYSGESNSKDRVLMELCVAEPESVQRFFEEEETLVIGCHPQPV